MEKILQRYDKQPVITLKCRRTADSLYFSHSIWGHVLIPGAARFKMGIYWRQVF